MADRNFSDRDYFKKVMETRTAQISEPFLSVQSHHRPLVAIVAPVFGADGKIAASIMLLEPGLLRGGALLRAVMPLESDPPPDLAGTAVLISAGKLDPFSPAARTQRLADVLAAAGADVALRWQRAGHELVPGDLEDARAWLSQRLGLARA